MTKHKFIAVILLLIHMLLLPGCWNYNEIEARTLVAGIAIDKGKNGSDYHITFDTIDASGNSKVSIAKSKLISSDGDTVFEAARDSIRANGKKLYLGDCQVIIIGKELAKDGVIPVLDFLNRDAELRLTMYVLISKTDKAEDILTKSGTENQIISNVIVDAIKTDNKVLSREPVVQLYQVNNTLADDGVSLILPMINIKNEKEPTSQLDGIAIFKKDKLIGELNSNEGIILLLIINQVKGGLFLVCDNSDNPNITLEIKDCSTKIKPVISGDSITMKIYPKLRVALAENENSKDYSTDKKIKELQKVASEQLDKQIEDMIKNIKTKYNSDIFGFGQKIKEANLQYWNKIKNNWDTEFQKLNIEVSSEIEISDTAKNQSKVKAGGGS